MKSAGKRTMNRRRRETKTDYGKRIKFLKSGAGRIVFRKTNKYIIAQYVTSKEAQDKVEFGISSKDLLKFGYPKEASLKNLSAAYLTGLLFGKKVSEEKVIFDVGMIRNLHKSKVYAFLKGLVDAGVKIKYDEKVFPDEARIKGEHLKNKIPFDEIKSKVEAK